MLSNLFVIFPQLSLVMMLKMLKNRKGLCIMGIQLLVLVLLRSVRLLHREMQRLVLRQILFVSCSWHKSLLTLLERLLSWVTHRHPQEPWEGLLYPHSSPLHFSIIPLHLHRVFHKQVQANITTPDKKLISKDFTKMTKEVSREKTYKCYWHWVRQI